MQIQIRGGGYYGRKLDRVTPRVRATSPVTERYSEIINLNWLRGRAVNSAIIQRRVNTGTFNRINADATRPKSLQ